MRIYCAVSRILFITSSAFLHSASSLISNKRGSRIRNRIVSRNMSNNNVSSTPAVLLHKSPFLDDDNDTQTQTQTALVILNSPIRQPPSPLFEALWNKSQYRVCADGGANRLYRSTVFPGDAAAATATPAAAAGSSHVQVQQSYIPNLIIGDLDSLQKRVSDYYKAANDNSDGSTSCSIVCDPDQDRNDLDKSLGAILEHQHQSTGTIKIGRVLVYGAFGGRFDQEMGCIQALYKWSHQFDYNMWLYDDQTVCWLLPGNRMNHIQIPHFDNTVKNIIGEGPTCGLIPMGVAVDSVTSVGLKWDLKQDATAFGGLVSTSNRVMAETVTVTASHPLVFTAEVFSGIPEQNSEEEEEEPN